MKQTGKALAALGQTKYSRCHEHNVKGGTLVPLHALLNVFLYPHSNTYFVSC